MRQLVKLRLDQSESKQMDFGRDYDRTQIQHNLPYPQHPTTFTGETMHLTVICRRPGLQY